MQGVVIFLVIVLIVVGGYLVVTGTDWDGSNAAKQAQANSLTAAANASAAQADASAKIALANANAQIAQVQAQEGTTRQQDYLAFLATLVMQGSLTAAQANELAQGREPINNFLWFAAGGVIGAILLIAGLVYLGRRN